MQDKLLSRRPTMSSLRKCVRLVAIWSIAFIAILPALFHFRSRGPHLGLDRNLRIGAVYCLAFLICRLVFVHELKSLGKQRAFALVFLSVLLSAVQTNLHIYSIDHGLSLSSQTSNVNWQVMVQDSVIKLSPSVLPHSYRFLPNAIVRWMQVADIDFETARDLYRFIFGILLVYALYRYGRLYTNYLGALIAIMLTWIIYPVSFEFYAGQLTDPMSHLSFVLAMIFLETDEFSMLLSTLVIGSLAKETVLCFAVYYLLFKTCQKHYKWKAPLLLTTSIGTYLIVRLYVLRTSLGFHQISGMSFEHVKENLRAAHWPMVAVLTAGALIPFLVTG